MPQSQRQPLTDTQLRATPPQVALDAASLAALESITAVVSGDIALDSATLTALETIGLDAATLSALETTELGATTLAALESITATISGDVTLSSATLTALETIGLDASTLSALETIGLGATTLAALETIAVTGPATDAQLRATPLPVSGTVTASGPLTDAQLRASAISVEQATSVDVADGGGSLTVDGPVTDAQLRATPVEVEVTGGGGGLTDTELRATPVPVEQASSVDVADGGGSLTVDNAVLSVVGSGAEATAQRVTLSTEALAALETIELGATTLAALETINAVIADGGGSITVDDGGTTITVDGEVALASATLTALETIELGATTLAALESITVVDGGGSLTVDGPLTDAQLRATPIEVDTGASGGLTDAELRAVSVPVEAEHAQPAVVTDTITGVGQDVTVNCVGYSTAIITIWGTYAAPILTFYGTDGVIFAPVSVMTPQGTVTTSGVLTPTANSENTWIVPVSGFSSIQLYSTGGPASGTINVTVSLSAAPNNVVPPGVDTELPTAAALSDTVSRTQTVPNVGAALLIDNATNLVRARGDTTAGLWVQNKAALPAGTNNIGDVDVLTLPATPAGTNDIGKVGHNVTGIGQGRKIVTTAGTRVVLASTTAAKQAVITAETDNTGIVVVGGTGVIAALATREGTPLNPGDTITLPCDDLNDINLDSMVSGDGVTFTYVT